AVCGPMAGAGAPPPACMSCPPPAWGSAPACPSRYGRGPPACRAPRSSRCACLASAEFTKAALQQVIRNKGFADTYDYLYLPRCYSSRACAGCAFINMVTEEIAWQFIDSMEGIAMPDGSVLSVRVATTQGLAENMVRWCRRHSHRVRDAEVLPFVRALHTLGIVHPSQV
ncbi:unnamed protein product, partial [Prorocentrum cordatum]